MYFIVKELYKKEIREILKHYNTIDNWLSFLDEEQLKILINLNYDINKICIKAPHKYKVGDYVTCLDEISYELIEIYRYADKINKSETSTWGKNKTFQVDRMRGGGITLFTNEVGDRCK